MTAVNVRRLRLAEFILDLDDGCLWSGGQRINLPPKVLAILERLVVAAPRAVTKDDLVAAVWPDGAVADATLTQRVKELRRLLGDDARRPRYVETVARRGYRLIAPLAGVVSEDDKPQPGAAALVVLLVEPGPGAAPEAAALAAVVRRQLGASLRCRLVSNERVAAARALLRHQAGVPLDERSALQVARRDGTIDLVIVLEVRNLGRIRMTDARVIRVCDGEMLFAGGGEIERGSAPAALFQLATELAAAVSGSRAGRPRVTKRWPRVTTDSLDALEAYARALECCDHFEWRKAADLLRQATLADREFAMAWTWLASAYLWLEQPGQAAAAARSAIACVRSVNEAERHFIVAAEAMYSGRLDEAIDQLELLLALDPDDFWGAFRLAHAYLAAGRVGDSLRLREHCARLRPDHFLNFSESGFTRLFAAGDLEGAGEDYQRVLALDPEHPFAIPYLLPSFQAWLARDLTRARRLLDRVLDRNMEGFLPLGRTSALVHDARFRLFTGDAAGAVAQLRFGVEGTTPGSTLHGWVRIELALTLRDLGDRPGFLAEMAGVENGGTPLNRAQAWLWLALDAVRAGERGRARTLAATLRSMAIPETSEFGYPIGRIVDRVRRVYPTLIEGESSLASGDARSAVDRFSEAVEVLPLALDAPVPLSTTGPRVHLAAREGLARALAAAGKAREAEDAESWLVRHRLQLFVTSRAGVGLWLGALARRAALLVARGRRADATRDAGQVIAYWGRLEPRPEPVMAAQRVLDGLRRRSSTPPVAAGTGLSSRRVR